MLFWAIPIAFMIVLTFIGYFLAWDQKFIESRRAKAIAASPEKELVSQFAQTLADYRALPEEFQHGDLLPVLLGIQNTAGGREAVNEHFNTSDFGRSVHYYNCNGSSSMCTGFPDWQKIRNAVKLAKEEAERADAANREFENRHTVEQAQYILEGIKSSIADSEKIRRNLKELQA